jgi:hypothetical protein
VKEFFKKIWSGLKKVGKWLLVWGKPLIREALRNKLVPMLQNKINAGAVDKHVDNLIKECVEEFIKKYF